MVSVPTCWPAKAGARTERLCTASVVPFRRKDRFRSVWGSEECAGILVNEGFLLATATRSAPTTSVTMAAIRMRCEGRLNAELRPGESSGCVSCRFGGGTNPILPSAPDEDMPKCPRRSLRTTCGICPTLELYYPSEGHFRTLCQAALLKAKKDQLESCLGSG